MQIFSMKNSQIKFNDTLKYHNIMGVGYISGIQEWMNIYKTINVIHHVDRVRIKNITG
jgi:hypothetical protein